MRVYGSTIVSIFPVHMRQARCREIDSRAGQHPVLDCNVFEMMILNLGCGFNFDQSPALVFATMEYIDAHENAIVLKRAFKDRRDVSVSDYLSRGADHLIQAPLAANFDATRKHLAGEHADLASLLNDRLCRSIRLGSQYRLVNLKVDALQALAASNEFRFAQFDITAELPLASPFKCTQVCCAGFTRSL